MSVSYYHGASLIVKNQHEDSITGLMGFPFKWVVTNYENWEEFIKLKGEPTIQKESVMLHYELVSSPGPRIGFFGFILDIPTGRLLLEGINGEEAPALLDLYGYWKKWYKFEPNVRILTTELEKWKMGEQGLVDALYRTANKQQQEGIRTGSIVRNLIADKKSTTELGDLFTYMDMVTLYEDLLESLMHFSRSCEVVHAFFTRMVRTADEQEGVSFPGVVQGMFQEADKQSTLGTDYEGREVLFSFLRRRGMNNLKERKENVSSTIKYNERKIASELMMSLSQPVESLDKPKKSEITAMSMFDLIKSSPVGVEFEDAVSDIFSEGMTEKDLKELLKRSIDDSGVRNLIAPGTMSAVGRAMTRRMPMDYAGSDGGVRWDTMSSFHPFDGSAEIANIWSRAIRSFMRLYKRIEDVYA